LAFEGALGPTRVTPADELMSGRCAESGRVEDEDTSERRDETSEIEDPPSLRCFGAASEDENEDEDDSKIGTRKHSPRASAR